MKPRLGSAAVKLIETAVEALFEKIRNHTLGDKHPTGKRLYIAYRPDLTLKGIFDLAAAEEGVRPDQDVLKTLLKISNSYIDATKERAKAKVVQSVQAFLTDAGNKGVKTNIETVLGGKLYEVMGEATRDLKRIFETESTVVRNTSIMDGIVRANAAAGIDDPCVFFVTVRDGVRCPECTRLHVQPDQITPRVWRLSELGSGYHKKGDPTPKVGGLHPHCRCVLTTLMLGYGFNAAGRVQYKSPGYDEFKVQRGMEKTEEEIGEPLQKGFKQAQIKHILKRFGWVEKPGGGGHDMMEHPTIGAKIPFQRGYAGDYDWPWVDKHLKSAGLVRSRQNEITADPDHPYHPHYVAAGLAEPPGPQMKTWHPQGVEKHVPLDQVEIGGQVEGRAHADAVQKLKAGHTNLPPVDVLDMGDGTFGSMNNHHLLQAARDSGMTHVPVRVVTDTPPAP